MSVLPALVGAAVCGVGGALTPYLIRRLPEPGEDPEVPEDEPAKIPHADLGARPGLGRQAAALSAVAGAGVGGALGWDSLLVLLWPIVPVGVLLAIVDAHTRLLPKLVVLPATGAALLYGVGDWLVTGDPATFLRGLIALLVMRSVFWVLWFVHAAGLGFGDVRLTALLGCALGYAGWAEVFIGFWTGLLVFGAFGVGIALARRDRSLLKRAYPFGPFLLAGGWLGLLFADPVARAMGY